MTLLSVACLQEASRLIYSECQVELIILVLSFGCIDLVFFPVYLKGLPFGG